MSHRYSRLEVFLTRLLVVLGIVAFFIDAVKPQEDVWLDENGHTITQVVIEAEAPVAFAMND